MILGLLRNASGEFHPSRSDRFSSRRPKKDKKVTFFSRSRRASISSWARADGISQHFVQGFPSHDDRRLYLYVFYIVCVYSLCSNHSHVFLYLLRLTCASLSLSLITSVLSYIGGNMSICSCLSLLSLFPCHLQDCHYDPLVNCPKKNRWKIAIL